MTKNNNGMQNELESSIYFIRIQSSENNMRLPDVDIRQKSMKRANFFYTTCLRKINACLIVLLLFIKESCNQKTEYKYSNVLVSYFLEESEFFDF